MLGATTLLRDFALITSDVDPSRLVELLPSGAGLEPDTVTPLGRSRALVSAVNFRDVEFRFRIAPLLRASFVQTNYRAYVRRNGEPSVWFFGTTLGSQLSIVPRMAWGMPWYPVRSELSATWRAGHCDSYESRSSGSWGSAQMRLTGANVSDEPLAGFTSREEALFVLTHPLIGYFGHRRGGIGRYSVWHAPLQPSAGRAIEARFDVFTSLRLIEPDQAPHSVLLQQESEFLVQLPPRRADPS